MRVLVLLLLAASLYGGYQWWQDRSGAGMVDAGASPNGFIPVEMPTGAPRGAVLVLAPPNCPSEQAKRSEALVASLSRAGIPVKRGSSMAFDVVNPTREQREGVDRAVKVFQRGAPAVFVNGMAMSNPTPEQAIREYRRTKG